MTANERREIYFSALTPDTAICVNCTHFYGHYSKDARFLHCGHCAYPRFKHVEAWGTCGKFECRIIKKTVFKEAI